MYRKLIHIIGVFHIVVAVNCMLIGVIVEFHQVHVYKNNISFWHLQATKTAGKDGKKYLQPLTGFVKALSTDCIIHELQSCVDRVQLNRFENTIYSRHLFDLVNPEYIYNKALRGPPRS